tara:strand:+ start:9799 stop:12375 length:2577 start_codon:yes stop_codon:yes gene_type:complete
MKKIILCNSDFIKLNPKYKLLVNHSKFKHIFNEYINSLNKLVNHDWINYITYNDIKSNNIIIYFRKFIITKFDKSNKVTIEYVINLIDKIINIIIDNSVNLPICYLYDILRLNKNNIHTILNKRNNTNKIQINFKITNKKIIFFIKYTKFFKCNIHDFDKNLDIIYKKYKEIEKNKKKIIFLINQSRRFNCEDTLCELEIFFFKKGFWLDISFHYSLNRYQNRSQYSVLSTYFIKYDIILLYSNFNQLKNINFKNIKNKLIITIPIDLTVDRILSNESCIDPKNINNNKLYWGKKKLEDIENFISFRTNVGIFNKSPYENYKYILHKLLDLSNNKLENLNISTKYFNILKPITDKRNENILSKKNFFDLYNFDINKKLITVFIRWPKCTFESHDFLHYNVVRDIYFKNNFIECIFEELKDDYNILFKGHPFYFTNINNTFYFNNTYLCKSERNYYGVCNDKLIIYFKDKIKCDGFKWYKDDILISENTNKLIIKKVKNTDIGVYKLILPNKKEYSITLSIMKKDNKLNIFDCNENNSYLYVNNINLSYKWENKDYPGIILLDKYKFFTNNYENELYKYTNFGMCFMDTTVALDCSLYNIPILLISSKNKYKDWFNLDKYYFNLLTDEEKKKLYKIYNNLDIFQKNIWREGINGICGGIKLYWEDIKDQIKFKLKKIIENEEKYRIDFKKKNIFFDTSHVDSQERVGSKILEIINESNVKNIKDSLIFLLHEESIITYQKQYINVLFKNEIITIEILKIPYINNKFVSSGVSIYIYNIEPLCKINIKFNIKLQNKEENVYVRLYTGIKWIVYKETHLTTNFQQIDITEDFNLESKSKWRISTTSQKVGQKIYIKDINFT